MFKKAHFYEQPKNKLGINRNDFTNVLNVCDSNWSETVANDDKCATIPIQRLRGLITKRMSPSSTALHNWEHTFRTSFRSYDSGTHIWMLKGTEKKSPGDRLWIVISWFLPFWILVMKIRRKDFSFSIGSNAFLSAETVPGLVHLCGS